MEEYEYKDELEMLPGTEMSGCLTSGQYEGIAQSEFARYQCNWHEHLSRNGREQDGEKKRVI